MTQRTKIRLFMAIGTMFHATLILLAIILCVFNNISYYYAVAIVVVLYLICGVFSSIYQSKYNLFTIIDSSIFIYSYLRYGKWIRHNNVEYLIAYQYGELDAVYFVNPFVYDHTKITLYFKGETDDFNRITDVINNLVNKRVRSGWTTDSEFVKWDGYLDQESRRVGNIDKLLK
jgi:hypothetical protein